MQWDSWINFRKRKNELANDLLLAAGFLLLASLDRDRRAQEANGQKPEAKTT